MAWLISVTATIILWVISLCKTLYFSRPISATSIFLNESGPANTRRNTLLVIAHPDDESMFFSPTLLILALYHHNVHILCISTGNADGRGEIRKIELYRACTILQVPQENIKIIDHKNLQDGFGKTWDHRLLAKIIGKEIITRDIDLIITFDSHGVSGHCNHRDVHYGVRMYLSEGSARNIEAWELASTSIYRKYSGPVDVWLSNLYTQFYPRGQSCVLVNAHPKKCYLAMAEHESQWVWFRKLFVVLSSYSYVNVLKKFTP